MSPPILPVGVRNSVVSVWSSRKSFRLFCSGVGLCSGSGSGSGSCLIGDKTKFLNFSISALPSTSDCVGIVLVELGLLGLGLGLLCGGVVPKGVGLLLVLLADKKVMSSSGGRLVCVPLSFNSTNPVSAVGSSKSKKLLVIDFDFFGIGGGVGFGFVASGRRIGFVSVAPNSLSKSPLLFLSAVAFGILSTNFSTAPINLLLSLASCFLKSISASFASATRRSSPILVPVKVPPAVRLLSASSLI